MSPAQRKVGQASILSAAEWKKLESECKHEHHRLIWAIARYTGARIGEILLLSPSDAYCLKSSKPLDAITFRKETRKGKDKNHAVPVSPALRGYLLRYPVDIGSQFLFPSPRNQGEPISYEAALRYLQACSEACGLGHKRITTHSGRRSLITALARAGTDIKTIQNISGHRSIQNLTLYIDTDPAVSRRALENLDL